LVVVPVFTLAEHGISSINVVAGARANTLHR
jgi:hypothetical protein